MYIFCVLVTMANSLKSRIWGVFVILVIFVIFSHFHDFWKCHFWRSKNDIFWWFWGLATGTYHDVFTKVALIGVRFLHIWFPCFWSKNMKNSVFDDFWGPKTWKNDHFRTFWGPYIPKTGSGDYPYPQGIGLLLLGWSPRTSQVPPKYPKNTVFRPQNRSK